MAKNLMQYTCCLIVLTSCVDQGDGSWKKKEREKLQHDIILFKKMSEKIEQEIEAFYEDYPDEQIKGDNIEKIRQEYIKNSLDRKTDAKVDNVKETTQNFSFTSQSITDYIPTSSSKVQSIESVSGNQVPITSNKGAPKDSVNSNVNWPKFEDILLAMGKKYDWKNDRWIKVKGKLKESRRKKVEEDNSIKFLEKHKFSYRTVKLNRSKSRRNVVIAVSAVR